MSTPNFDPDDPRLTAYALGESSSAAERQEVEALLAASPDARAAVEHTRVLARLLEEEFARENAVYQQAHRTMAVPDNLIPFPGPARRWRNISVLGGTIAAVLVAMGTLVLPAIRRKPPFSVASIQPAAPPASEQVATPLSAVEGVPTDSPPLLADAIQPTPRGGAADSLDKSSEAENERFRGKKTQADELAMRRPGAAPQVAAAPVTAAVSQPPSPPVTAMVRIRQRDGTFVGGVLLSADGRVLAARELPDAEKPGALLVTLSDGRQLPANAPSTGSRFATRQLQIKAVNLPHITLATKQPAAEAQLSIARTDSHDGSTSFTQTNLSEADAQARGGVFVFNAAGELLANEPTSAVAKSAILSRSAARRNEAAATTLVRPFTAAERAALTGSEK